MNIFYRIFFLFAIFSLFACGSKKNAEASVEMTEADVVEEAGFSDKEYASPSQLSSKRMNSNRNRAENADVIERKLIKTGNVSFESEDIKASRSLIDKIVEKYKAYINNESENSSKTMLEQDITIKIPKDAFDSFISELLNGVKHVNSKNIYIQDVTEEFIDIVARLKVKKEAEQTYLRLLNTAKTVRDVLDIQDQVQSIRADIESIEGRLKYLQASVDYSTLNIHFYQFIASSSKPQPLSFFRRVASSIKEGLNLFSEVIITILNVWVFIVIAVVLFLLVRAKFRYDRERKNEHK